VEADPKPKPTPKPTPKPKPKPNLDAAVDPCCGGEGDKHCGEGVGKRARRIEETWLGLGLGIGLEPGLGIKGQGHGQVPGQVSGFGLGFRVRVRAGARATVELAAREEHEGLAGERAELAARRAAHLVRVELGLGLGLG